MNLYQCLSSLHVNDGFDQILIALIIHRSSGKQQLYRLYVMSLAIYLIYKGVKLHDRLNRGSLALYSTGFLGP